MRNALLPRHRKHLVSHGLFVSNVSIFSKAFLSWKMGLDIGFLERNDRTPPFSRSFSTVFTSVHGEKPSAEYARRRKQSLETEFGHMLGMHGSKTLYAYSRFGPFLALYRAAIISFQVFKLSISHFFVQDIHKRAVKFRETLISLGPFYTKLGQALSTRPDILPKAYCQELSKLLDQIPPFPSHIAIKSIESQLGAPIFDIFSDISPEPIAAASLGQVYKAHLLSGELVAVKVQRPGMALTLTLDALLFHMIGGQLKRFAKARKDLLVAVNEMVRHMFEEIDYILEAQNAEKFAALYALPLRSGESKRMRLTSIKVPKIYWNYTRKAVLTMEWIDGIKLIDSDRISEVRLNRKLLIDQGVYCSLRQLLVDGFFHADPHPGNLVATDDGSLAYFDFGMMGDIPRHYRVGLIKVLVHFVNRDSLGLANDFLSLGFIPDEEDTQLVADALRASFDTDRRLSNDFQGVMYQLYDVMYEFNFSLPPDYALVIRALGSLEGTAKALDPDFKVIESAYPFVVGRLLADPDPDMRKILRELLICNDGSIRWNRFERLIAAISDLSSEETNESSDSASRATSVRGWKSFDMHSVVAATEDLLCFVLSVKGQRVRVFLLRDIIKVADAFLKEETFRCRDLTQETTKCSQERVDLISRIWLGLQSFQRAVSLAPELWAALLIRMLLKPELHIFLLEILTAIVDHSKYRLPEAFWLCSSRILHILEENILRHY
ncbi:uncharacterized protein LOC110100309 isoform X1 [Dendrobium catenatum]|uniref:Putative aarF domain-containing protein kinase n=1 Tax=Dendrobium catenatum TaxID=906689 RepID=A0A2I0W091_9ASPA|nr:uncharacterized protein LOC110100309 isoform X1 [Dendrobium catenatum]PKU69082.1 putative aarF domain-containing protein kinase [Dendrobium catenatum]